MTKHTIKRIAMHIPIGVVVPFCEHYGHWSSALIYGLGFLAYQFNQDWHSKGKSYWDIFGFLIGVPLGVGILRFTGIV